MKLHRKQSEILDSYMRAGVAWMMFPDISLVGFCGMEVVNAMIVSSEPATFLLLIRVDQANHTKRMVSDRNNARKECPSPNASYCQPTPLTHGAEDHRYPLCTMVASSRLI